MVECHYFSYLVQVVELMLLEGARNIIDNVTCASRNGHILTASFLMLSSHCFALDSVAVQNLTSEVCDTRHRTNTDINKRVILISFKIILNTVDRTGGPYHSFPSQGVIKEHGIDVDGTFIGVSILSDTSTELFFDRTFDLKSPIKLALEGRGMSSVYLLI